MSHAAHNRPRLVVTGASGFVGRHLVTAARAQGWRVTSLLRAGHPAAHDDAAIASDGSVVGLTQALLPHAGSIIVHCAAAFSPGDAPSESTTLVEANIAYPTRLLQAARSAGITSWINLGSLWEHDATGARHPVNHYAQMKLAFQDTLSYFARRHGLRTLTLKLSDTFGEDDTRPKLLNQLRDAYLQGAPFSLTSGTQIVNYCHISDVTRAMLMAAHHVAAQAPGFDVFHVVDGNEPLSVRDVIAKVGLVTERPLDVHFGDMPVDGFKPQHIWTGGPRLPGWSPRIDLLSGLKLMFRAEK